MVMPMIEIRLKKEILNPNRPEGSPKIRSLFYDWYKQDINIVIASGPRNTVKTSVALLNLMTAHSVTPKCQSLIVRPTYSSISDNLIPNFESLLHYAIDDRKKQPFRLVGGRDKPVGLRWDNGGFTRFGGMDREGEKYLGGAKDIVFYNQIEQEWNGTVLGKIIGCQAGARAGNLIGRDGKPTWLFWADANPSTKKHWVYKTFHPDPDKEEQSNGIIKHKFTESPDIEILSRWYDILHQDHPLFYNWVTHEWKEKGKQTRAGLLAANPPGHERDRMVNGKWCEAEGAVFPEFSEERHLIDVDLEEVNASKWIWICDWGTICAAGLYYKEGNKWTLFKEIYRDNISTSELIRRMRAIEQQYKVPVKSVRCDYEKQPSNELRDAGYSVRPVTKDKIPVGISKIKYALENNLIQFNKGSLVDPEESLTGKPQCTVDELQTMAYKPPDKMTGSPQDDHPDKAFPNHAVDCLKYLCSEFMMKRKKEMIISSFELG